MDNNKRTGSKPRILVLGSTGRNGKAVVAELEELSATVEVVRTSRHHDRVEAWKRAGVGAVYLDLDDPRTFPEALHGVDRLYLATGYTFQMVHQSKTIVDAAVDSGVGFIVHLGVFGDGRSTDPHFAWHEMIERYIEGSGLAWSHLHPHFFMDNLLTTFPVVDGHITWYAGDKQVGWVAVDDVAAVAARVLAEGPGKHAGQNYWLSTEVLNGVQAAQALTRGLGRPIDCVVMTPDSLSTLLSSGDLSMPSTLEANYGASALEWLRQTFDGRMDYGIVTTTTVQDLIGRPPITLVEWSRKYRSLILPATPAKESAHTAADAAL